jgi:hypothetical protein
MDTSEERMDQEKAEEIRTVIKNMERLIDSGQDLARSMMDREPSQKSQNNNWRYVRQELMDLKKLLGVD